ncbi:hypothetical protein LOTGIDRAFT_176695, partial [Lottia gigantea]
MILNRECTVTTTKDDISLTIKKLNLKADDCCRFNITRHNVSEYCSQNGSFIPPNARYIGKKTASVRLENVVNKDGESFSILVKAAGNVTIDCRTIEQDNIQGSSMPSTTSPSSKRMEDPETNLAGTIGGTVGGVVVLVVIIVIIISVLVVKRRRRRPKDKVNENNYYSTVDDDPKGNSNYTYIDVDLDKVGYSKINNPGANQGSHAKERNPNEEKRKNPKFKRQDFSFVERNFEKMNDSKDARKRNVPNATANPERKEDCEPANYTYIDDSMIKAPDKPSASAAKDGGQRNAGKESSTAQYTKVDKKK